MKIQHIFLLSSLLLILDQLSKWYFTGKDITLLSFVSFSYVENTGVAFGLFQGYNGLFIIVSVVILAFLWKYFRDYPLALSLFIAGTLGNLLDRVFFGYVRDFVAVGSWPVFNLADSYNTIAVIILLYLLYKEEKAL